MLATERSQPMRVCAGAGPFSARWFGSAKGTSLKPSPISPASAYSVASKVDAIGGNTLRCSHAVGFPSAPSVALKYIAAAEQRHIYSDVFFLDADRGGDCFLRALGVL